MIFTLLIKVISMKCLFFSAMVLLLSFSLVSAQTVVVDNTNASPNNTSTFSSLMMAIHSFQASGATTAASPGGVGVNHGNSAANVIQVIATGTKYTGVQRIDERTASSEQSIQDQNLTITGVASGSYAKPIIAPMPDAAASSLRGFETRTDISLELHNMIFMYDPAATVVYSYVLSFDRLTATSGTPSTILVKDCVFTGADAAGAPLTTNADEAFVDRRADLVNPAGGAPGRTTALIPDKNEGMLATFENCVFGTATNYTGSRACSLYVYFGGTGTTADTSWSETAGLTIKSCTFTYGPASAIEMQSGGSNVNSANQFINITGSNAVTGGLAAGSPTIMAYYGHSANYGVGCGIYLLPSNATNNPNGVMSGRWDNLWIAGTTGSAIFDDVTETGGTFYWSLKDSVIFNCNTNSGSSTIRSGWKTVTTPTSDTVSLENVTILGGNADAATTGSALNLLGSAVSNKAMNVKVKNVIFGRSATATGGPIRAILNGGTAGGANVVTVDNSSFITAGPFALGASAPTSNAGAGSITPSGIINADPSFRNSDDIQDAKFLVVADPSYVGAGPSGSNLVGGRYWEAPPTPTPTPIPPAAARMWNIYE